MKPDIGFERRLDGQSLAKTAWVGLAFGTQLEKSSSNFPFHRIFPAYGDQRKRRLRVNQDFSKLGIGFHFTKMLKNRQNRTKFQSGTIGKKPVVENF